MQDSEFAASIV